MIYINWSGLSRWFRLTIRLWLLKTLVQILERFNTGDPFTAFETDSGALLCIVRNVNLQEEVRGVLGGYTMTAERFHEELLLWRLRPSTVKPNHEAGRTEQQTWN